MSALEDSLRAVYKLPQRQTGAAVNEVSNMLLTREMMQNPPPMQNMPMTPEMMQNPPVMMPMEMPEELTAEDQALLDKLQRREAAIQSAPLGPLVQQLRQQGQEEDTELAHLRLGEVILTPEMLEDDAFANVVEKKFAEEGIDPEDATVGGIRNLNQSTGIQQFFIKKLAKGLKKVVKKVAPIAQFIPGPIGAAASIYNKGRTILNVAKGKANPLELLSVAGPMSTGPTLGDSFKTLTGAAAAGAGQGGIRGFIDRAKEYILPGEDKVGLFGNIRKGIGAFMGVGAGADEYTPMSDTMDGPITGYMGPDGQVISVDQYNQMVANQGRFFGSKTPQGIKTLGDAIGLGGASGLRDVYGAQQQLYDAEGNPVQQRGGVLSNILGGGGAGGGFGNFAKLAGIGALSAGLGKLAYEDAKKQKGVALTPLTTMSPTGRYNIEAEIARRMGQARPNPVEFGLLPEGTLPVLSGGQPRQVALGGAIEELEGGMARGMQDGGEMANRMRGFVTRMKMADDKIDAMVPTKRETGAVVNERELPPGGMRDTMIQALLPESIEDMFRSERVLDFEKAVNDFAGALLRVETGAVITDDELDFVMRTYMPKPGDTPNTILEKSNARKRVIQSLMPKQETKSKGIGPMMAMMGGGPIMAYAQGGAVAMQEGGEMDPSQFPRMDGDINGPGTEQSDDIPAMLSDGEFVMTARAVRGAGSYEMKTEPGGIINLVPSLEEDRERGMDVMYKVMDTFSGQAQPS